MAPPSEADWPGIPMSTRSRSPARHRSGARSVRAATGNLKKVSLELGGKSPVLVFADADVDAAIAGAARAIFSNAGQVCTAGSRLIVAEEVYDDVVAGVAAAAGALNVGYSFDPRSEMGPVISAEQRETVMGYIDSGISDGATLLAGGHAAGPGFFIEPTVLGDTRTDMRASRRDLRARRHGDACHVRRRSGGCGECHQLRPGGVGVDSRRGTAHSVAGRLRVGRVGINVHGLADVTMPTGGFKESGWGRELGPEGLDLFLESTSVFTRLD